MFKQLLLKPFASVKHPCNLKASLTPFLFDFSDPWLQTCFVPCTSCIRMPLQVPVKCLMVQTELPIHCLLSGPDNGDEAGKLGLSPQACAFQHPSLKFPV